MGKTGAKKPARRKASVDKPLTRTIKFTVSHHTIKLKAPFYRLPDRNVGRRKS